MRPPVAAQGDRDLVFALRAELAAIIPTRACDRRAELAGLLATDPVGTPVAEPGGGSLPRRLRRDPGLARLVRRLWRDVELGRRRTAEAAGRGVPVAFSWAQAADHCRAAYVRGLFLGHGSLSMAAGRTHLELVLDPGTAGRLAPLLADLGWPPGIRLRRRRGVLTWKSSEVVGLILRRMGAASALLELEARGAARALVGELNRVLNAESANLARMVAAATRQGLAIRRLQTTGRLATLDETLRRIAAARLAAPEATLAELAAGLGLHRSLVQRSLRRLEDLAREAGGPGGPPAERPSRQRPSAGGAIHLA